MKIIFTLFLLVQSAAIAGERLAVQIPSDDERQVQDLLDNLRISVDNEDAKTYLSCFTKERSSKIKKKIALMFMKYDLSMEIDKFNILDSDEDSVEFVAKYTIYEDSTPIRIVSSVIAKREADCLFVSKEEIISRDAGKRRKVEENNDDLLAMPLFAQNDQQNNCPDGRCPIPNPKPKVVNKEGREVLDGIGMFNDENGNPSENGIMWIDPKKLLAKFPDKYGVPPCFRAKMVEVAE